MTAKVTSAEDLYAGTLPRKDNRDRAEERTRFQISEGAAVLDGPPRWVLHDNLTGYDYPFGSYSLAYSGYTMIRDSHPMAPLLFCTPSKVDAYYRRLETLQNIPDVTT